MATRYSKDKYARVESLKNEPLYLLTPGSKKRKLDEGKDETPAPLSFFGTPSSPTPSLEMMAFTSPTTHSKGKGKVGKSVWKDPTTALGQVHNIITDDELRGLLSIPSHELVVVANSKVDSIEAESSKLRKDLIEVMDQATKAKEKVKELKDALKVEKKLVTQKDKKFKRPPEDR
nr:hypothetical protein CFP56_60143 [Quercus suber]POE97287.1 hypothetical protein CFP56_75556 [Quercus suber]